MDDAHEAVEILLVEDNATDAELCIRALKQRNLANHLVWVKDGAEALDFLFAAGAYAGRKVGAGPKVILLDLRLPRVDGVEVLRQVKSDARTKAIPVVVLTSSKEDRDVVQSYLLGVNSFVSKPVQFEEFSHVVAELGLYWLLVNRASGAR
jgi:CheY-like chemotaxis protein